MPEDSFSVHLLPCPICGDMMIVSQPETHSEYAPFGICSFCKAKVVAIVSISNGEMKLVPIVAHVN